MQEVQSPPTEQPTQEQFDLRKYVADLLTANRQDKQKVAFGSVGKGILGGLFNAAGGIISGLAGVMNMDDPLGTKGIGDKLFGTHVEDISSIELAKLLMQESGMKEELAFKKQELADRTEQNKAMMKLQTDMQAAEQKHEMAMAKAQMDQRASLLNEQFKHDESMSKLDSSQRLSMATTMAAIELQNTSALTKQQFEDTLKLLEKGNSFTAWEKMKDRTADMLKLSQQFGHEQRMIDIQQSFEEGRTTQTLKAHREAAELEATSRVKAAEVEAGSRVEAANANAAAKTAKEAPKAEAQKNEQQKERMDREGRLRFVLDSTEARMNEEGTKGTAILTHAGIGLRELMTRSGGELTAFQEGLPDDVMKKVEEFTAHEAERLADQYENDPDGLAAALDQTLQASIKAVKDTLFAVKAAEPVDGEKNPFDDDIYATTDAMLSQLSSGFKAAVSNVSPRVVNNSNIESSLRQAWALIDVDQRMQQRESQLTRNPITREQLTQVNSPVMKLFADKPAVGASEEEMYKWGNGIADHLLQNEGTKTAVERNPQILEILTRFQSQNR